MELDYKFLKFGYVSDDKIDGRTVKVRLSAATDRRLVATDRRFTFPNLKTIANDSLPENFPERDSLLAILSQTTDTDCWANQGFFNDALCIMFQLLNIVDQQHRFINGRLKEMKIEYDASLQKEREARQYDLSLLQKHFTETVDALDATVSKRKAAELESIDAERVRLSERCETLEHLAYALKKEYDMHLQMDYIQSRHSELQEEIASLEKSLKVGKKLCDQTEEPVADDDSDSVLSHNDAISHVDEHELEEPALDDDLPFDFDTLRIDLSGDTSL